MLHGMRTVYLATRADILVCVNVALAGSGSGITGKRGVDDGIRFGGIYRHYGYFCRRLVPAT